MKSDELTHHGVMGMKWGVRRFQNVDGSLTRAGRKRFELVKSDAAKVAKDSKQAVGVLNKSIKSNNRQAFVYNKLADFNRNRSSKYAIKSEKAATEGKSEKAERYAEKSRDAFSKRLDYRKTANKYLSESANLEAKVSDISNAKLKAGRDFVVQRDLNMKILRIPIAGIPVPIVTEERSIVERRNL